MSDASSATPTPRRSVLRILWRAMVVGSVLFTGGSAMKAGLIAIFTQCWDDNSDLASPDGQHIAHQRVHTCEGLFPANYTIRQTVDIARADSGGMARVYKSHEDSSKLRWEDNDHLRIDVDTVATIGLSLHKGAGVHVAYHVPRRLVSFERADARERQEEEIHQAGKESEHDYEVGKEVDRDLRSWDERFVQWASENAIVDDEVK